MRRVMIKPWIPAETIHTGEYGVKFKEGTNQRSQDFSEKAWFHQWVMIQDKADQTELAAIIEKEDGFIELFAPENVKFLPTQEMINSDVINAIFGD